MIARQRDIPLLGYAAAVALLLALLFWQSGYVRQRERDLLRQAAQARRNLSLSELFAEGSDVGREGNAVSGLYRSARERFKLGLLLVLAFPTAVLFPAWLTTYRPPEDKTRVVSARTMTRDDVDLGVTKPKRTMAPKTRLFVVNFSAFLAAAAALALFPLFAPRMYGGVRTWLLFAVAALMAFSGSALAYDLKEKYGGPRQVAGRLACGFVVLGALCWVFL